MRTWLGLVLLLLSAVCAHSQPKDLSGQWQGTLHAPDHDYRLVLKIAQGAGRINAVAYSIDEEPVAMPAAFVRNGSAVTVTIDQMGARFAGTLSADGGVLSGTYTQGRALPLELRHATAATLWVIDPSPHRVRRIAVEKDVKLEVLDWGGRGRPLIFLPGLGASAHVFDQFAPKFTAGHHVYAITRRGYGASGAPDPAHASYSASRLADDVAAVIDALKLDRPVLAGHSIAGGELSAMANRHPGKISGLVYLDAGYAYALYAPGGVVPFGVNLALDSKELAADQHADLAPTADAIAKFQALLRNFAADTAAAQTFLDAMSPVAAAANIGETQAQRRKQAIADAIVNGAEKFTAISVPVLAFFATDPKLPASLPEAQRKMARAQADAQARQADAFAAAVPSARVIRLAGAAHRVWLSDETQVVREMDAFMARLN